MKNYIFSQFKIGFLSLLFFTILTGLIYPLLMTGLAQLLFSIQANGSFIINHQNTVGSEFIGQYFSDPKYFWGRPSATSPYSYNALASSGSNLGPTNPALISAVKTEIEKLHAANPDNSDPIPIELLTQSGSGLDPHISYEAAQYQASRIAKIRNVPLNHIKQLIEKMIEKRQFGFLGEPRINVLKLNLALDEEV